MNIDNLVYGKIATLRQGIKEAEAAIKEIALARAFTLNFLRCCEATGIKRVGIRKTDRRIKGSLGWNDGFDACYADELHQNHGSNWPAIWRAVEMAGVSGGCGNVGQHQITDAALLIDGIYRLRAGKWELIKQQPWED